MATALQITDLFVLSDVLQMELELSSKGRITGTMKRSLTVPEIGLKMNMELKVVSSKVQWESEGAKVEPFIGLILQVHGDLHLLVLNDRLKGEVLVALMDESKAGLDLSGGLANFFEDHQSSKFQTLLKRLAPTMVAGFRRQEYGTTWRAAA